MKAFFTNLLCGCSHEDNNNSQEQSMMQKQRDQILSSSRHYLQQPKIITLDQLFKQINQHIDYQFQSNDMILILVKKEIVKLTSPNQLMAQLYHLLTSIIKDAVYILDIESDYNERYHVQQQQQKHLTSMKLCQQQQKNLQYEYINADFLKFKFQRNYYDVIIINLCNRLKQYSQQCLKLAFNISNNIICIVEQSLSYYELLTDFKYFKEYKIVYEQKSLSLICFGNYSGLDIKQFVHLCSNSLFSSIQIQGFDLKQSIKKVLLELFNDKTIEIIMNECLDVLKKTQALEDFTDNLLSQLESKQLITNEQLSRISLATAKSHSLQSYHNHPSTQQKLSFDSEFQNENSLEIKSINNNNSVNEFQFTIDK